MTFSALYTFNESAHTNCLLITNTQKQMTYFDKRKYINSAKQLKQKLSNNTSLILVQTICFVHKLNLIYTMLAEVKITPVILSKVLQLTTINIKNMDNVDCTCNSFKGQYCKNYL